MAKVLVDGEIKTLQIIDKNGVDWTQDFLGDEIELKAPANVEEYDYVMTNSDYEWFLEIIRLFDKRNELEEEYENKIGPLPKEYYNLMDYDVERSVTDQIDFLDNKLSEEV